MISLLSSEFYTLGLAHEDPHRRNLMWDRKNKKVYVCFYLFLTLYMSSDGDYLVA